MLEISIHPVFEREVCEYARKHQTSFELAIHELLCFSIHRENKTDLYDTLEEMRVLENILQGGEIS